MEPESGKLSNTDPVLDKIGLPSSPGLPEEQMRMWVESLAPLSGRGVGGDRGIRVSSFFEVGDLWFWHETRVVYEHLLH